MHPRMQREQKTIEHMIHIYCRDHHQTSDNLCPDCEHLLEYARKRLTACPFQEKKSTCGKCTVHCYKPGMREKVREVMRYAGPRMIWRHPILAIGHMFDGRREPPALKPKSRKSPDEQS